MFLQSMQQPLAGEDDYVEDFLHVRLEEDWI